MHLLPMMLAVAAAQAPSQVHRYRLDVQTANEVDQSSIGQPKQSDGLTTSAIITVTLSDTAGGAVARITVDSMSLVPSGALVEQLKAIRPNAAEEARGETVSAMIVNGKLRGAPQVSDSNPALGPVVQALGVLFPGIRRGIKVGDQWSDTSHVDNSSGTRRQTGQVIASWKVTGAEGDALVLEGTSTSHTRTDNGSGQVLTMTGSSHETVVIPVSGAPVRRARIETTSDMSITAPQLGAPLPGKNTGSLALTPIP